MRKRAPDGKIEPTHLEPARPRAEDSLSGSIGDLLHLENFGARMLTPSLSRRDFRARAKSTAPGVSP